MLANLALLPLPVFANCTTSGTATTCDTSSPSPWASTIGAGPAAPSGASVTLQPNAQVVVGDATAIALGDNANITVNSGALVQNTARTNNGLYGTGANTIDFRNNSTLTVQQGATVISAGTQGQAEAVNPEGSGNTIINNGTIRGVNSAAIWFQNTSGLNTVINNATGVIQAPSNVIGASGNGSVDFTNRGQVIGNLIFAGGSDTLHLYTGSIITGNFDGGGGNNLITLNGTGTGTLPGNIRNFQSLYKQDSGMWTLTGSIIGVTVAEVQQGILALDGNNSQYTGKVVVDPAGTLQAPAQSLPPTVNNNGLVQFTQNVDGTYAGLITGVGAVQKDGAGTLTLAPTAAGGNTYSGGTVLNQGVLAISADSAIGAPTGSLAFNGGTLQLDSSFDLAGTRPISVLPGNGTIDTQGFDSTIAQNITGAGSLTKQGSGTLTLNGENSYAGGTDVNEGTLVVGDGSSASASLSGGGPVAVAAGATLGGYGSVTGDVANSGTISVANALASLASGPTGNFQINGNLTNAGLAQLAGTNGVGNTLTVAGNYVGQNATLALNTYLAGDGAPSDKLVVSGGTASGTSTLNVQNAGGPGAPTLTDGIQVVQAANGATTNPGAFSLSGGGTIKAGAYEYFLVKGGESAGTGESWYLRNTIPASTETPPTGPTSPPGTPTPPAGQQTPIVVAPGTPAPIAEEVASAEAGLEPTANANPSANKDSVPVYRPEVPLYTEAPSVARQLGILQIDTFHDRQGEQGLLTESGTVPASWARAWGGYSNISQSGDVKPSFDGSVWGMQIGQDLYADNQPGGARNHYGFLLGFSRAVGDVDGLAMGQYGYGAGTLQVNAYSLGGYWTHIGAGGWYTDAVAMGSALTVRTHSNENVGGSTDGNAFTGSIEAGLPIALGYGLTLEPQAQLVWQWLSLDRFNDGISDVTWNNGNTFLGRIGARLQWTFDASGVNWKPYLRVNVLRAFGADDKTTFGGTTTLGTPVGQTMGQVGVGLVAQLTKHGSVFATASYLSNFGGEHQRVVTGNAGVRWSW
ncbi:autotransporter outer membrane beta-barrel domain-containing protein [Paraburkholderia sp.]|uniref:autotransporter family protein n=1 Tax=Paraburkholderia sp. TaxID=1926495 RepID=UPI0039E231C8